MLDYNYIFNFYHLEYLNYCLHLYRYHHNILVNAFFNLLRSNNLSHKNYQASSQKFRQIFYVPFQFFLNLTYLSISIITCLYSVLRFQVFISNTNNFQIHLFEPTSVVTICELLRKFNRL